MYIAARVYFFFCCHIFLNFGVTEFTLMRMLEMPISFSGLFSCSGKLFSPPFEHLYFLFSSCLIKFGVRIFRVFILQTYPFFSLSLFLVETFSFQNQSFSVYVSSLLLAFFTFTIAKRKPRVFSLVIVGHRIRMRMCVYMCMFVFLSRWCHSLRIFVYVFDFTDCVVLVHCINVSHRVSRISVALSSFFIFMLNQNCVR